MNWSITQELKKTFHLHALRHEANHHLTGRQWVKYSDLKTRCNDARNQEARLFNQRYETRIEQEYKKLLHTQNSKTKELKPKWAQNDSFDKSALLAQADTNVRNRHEQRLERVNTFETRELDILLQTSSRENQLTGRSKDAFSRASDRRLGKERRIHNQQNQRPIHQQER